VTNKPNVRSRATGRVTLSDVAQVAGLSPITVSRALRGERAVDPLLVERVKKAAKKLGYVPDPAARALASKKGSHVAVLIPMLSNALFVDLLESIQKELRAAEYQTFIGITHYDPGEEEQLLREQLQHRPAGLLVTGFDHTDASHELIKNSGIPFVHMMEVRDSPDLYCVGLSQTDAAAALTQYLLDKGHKRIAFAASQLDPRTLARLQGWKQTMQSVGLYDAVLEWRNPAPSSLALGGLMFEQIFATTPAVDAIFFCNDDLAQGALLSALRLNIAIPEQIGVVGFNDLTGSDQMLPPLTTVRTPRSEIGRQSALMLLELMRGKAPIHSNLDLGYEIVARASA
jgi:LacI family transcriptional regulator, gluconate utilization system Gnt-I transcriptional repressor